MKTKSRTPATRPGRPAQAAELTRLKQLKELLAASQPDMTEAESIRRLRAAEARLAEMKVAERDGQLIDAESVRVAVAERATAEREALLNWPARIAADLAAKFGVTERDLFTALDAAVRQYLTERSQHPVT